LSKKNVPAKITPAMAGVSGTGSVSSTGSTAADEAAAIQNSLKSALNATYGQYTSGTYDATVFSTQTSAIAAQKTELDTLINGITESNYSNPSTMVVISAKMAQLNALIANLKRGQGILDEARSLESSNADAGIEDNGSSASYLSAITDYLKEGKITEADTQLAKFRDLSSGKMVDGVMWNMGLLKFWNAQKHISSLVAKAQSSVNYSKNAIFKANTDAEKRKGRIADNQEDIGLRSREERLQQVETNRRKSLKKEIETEENPLERSGQIKVLPRAERDVAPLQPEIKSRRQNLEANVKGRENPLEQTGQNKVPARTEGDGASAAHLQDLSQRISQIESRQQSSEKDTSIPVDNEYERLKVTGKEASSEA
jgi:hypothetical protein